MIVSFIAGITASSFFGNPSNSIIIPLFIASLTASILLFILKKRTPAKVLLALTLFLFGAAYLRGYMESRSIESGILSYSNGKKVTVTGVVSAPVERAGRGMNSYIIDEVSIGGTSHKGKIKLKATKVSKDIGYGDRIKFSAYLRIPRNYKNPDAFDYERYLRLRGIAVTGSVRGDDNITILEKGYRRGLFYPTEKLKESFNDFIYTRGLSENRYIISALLFGGKKQIDRYAHRLFIDTGTAHILAISGLHMGVVALFVYFLAIFLLSRSERFALGHNIIKLSYFITLIFIILYSLLVGARVSSIRAAIMIGVYILAVLFDRAQNTMRTMFLAAFFILIIFPASLYDVSFLLSFSAVFSILYFYPKLNFRIDKFFERSDSYFKRSWSLLTIVKYSIISLVLSFVINLVILPIILYNFNFVSLSAPLINAVIIPIYSIVIIPLNFLIFFFYPISETLAQALLHFNEYIIHLTILILRFFDRHLNYPLYTVTPSAYEIVLYLALIFSLFKIRKKGYKAATLIIAVVFLFTLYFNRPNRYDEEHLTLHAIDVGQGESFLVRFPAGEIYGGNSYGTKTMLIDGGGSFYKGTSFEVGRDVVAKYLWNERISKIDYIVNSHPHPDHIGGLFFIAKNFAPEKIFLTGTNYDYANYDNFLRMNKDKIVYVTDENSTVTIGDARVEFINYDYDGPVKTNVDINRSSLLLKITYRGRSVLFTGDISSDVEEALIERSIDLKSDILKVAHHGSRGSTSERFLDAVSPEYAIISVGYNNFFRLPSKSTVRRLTDKGIKLYRTDRDGMITLKLSDEEIAVTTQIVAEGGGSPLDN